MRVVRQSASTQSTTAGGQAVIDACVLVNAALRDTLLRLAEPPHLCLPRWSADIIEETTSTLQAKLGCTPKQTVHLVDELQIHFPEAWVEGYQPLITAMTNDPDDRHVLAAAVRSGAPTIVTFNLKHFTEQALRPWAVQAKIPDDVLIGLFDFDPGTVMRKVQEQANEVSGGFERLMGAHSRIVPGLTALLRQHRETL